MVLPTAENGGIRAIAGGLRRLANVARRAAWVGLRAGAVGDITTVQHSGAKIRVAFHPI